MELNKRTKEEKDDKSHEDDDDEEEGEISFDDRIKFTDYVRKLTIEQMTHLVKMIQEECPNVLEDLDSDKLQIKINEIGKDSFDKFMKYVQNWGTKENKSKIASVDEEENSKDNKEEKDDPMKGQPKPLEKVVKNSENEEELKNEPSLDSSKYGPEGKRFKTE